MKSSLQLSMDFLEIKQNSKIINFKYTKKGEETREYKRVLVEENDNSSGFIFKSQSLNLELKNESLPKFAEFEKIKKNPKYIKIKLETRTGNKIEFICLPIRRKKWFQQVEYTLKIN